jgi:hypothetical protein
MDRMEPSRTNRTLARTRRDSEAADFFKEVFVCVSIPVAAFAFAYMTLHSVIRLFLG